MPDDQSAIERQLNDSSVALGSILQFIYGAYPKEVPVSRLVDSDTPESLRVTSNAVSVLHAMGVIRVRGGYLTATSRDAAFLLGSLSKFLLKNVPAIQDSEDAKHRYRELTKIFEAARIDAANRNQVDQQPLNRHRIVNVLIKGRMKRGWGYQDVYLHVYHPEWDSYHLVGWSQHEKNETDEVIAALAMRNHLGLDPSQYELDEIRNPGPVTRTVISETNGALTEYTFRLMIVKRIHARLSLSDRLKKDARSFRWFTWDEIRTVQAHTGEKIIFAHVQTLC